MSNLLYYSRNRCTSVEQISDTTLKSSCRLQDTLTEAFVEITVRLPDLEITDIKSELTRSLHKKGMDTDKHLQKVIGVRVGPGMLKIIKGLIGEDMDCRELTFMVEECCHGVILAFTKDTLIDVPKDKGQIEEFYKNMVRKNIRMYNRCAAFAPGSPLVEGFEPLLK